jgi:hypothetical protein
MSAKEWAQRQPKHGLWILSGDPAVKVILAQHPLDRLCIPFVHGASLLDWHCIG